MGLAKTVATRFPDWGPEFATLMVSLYFSLIHPLHCGFLYFQQRILAFALTTITVNYRAVSRACDCFLAQKSILKLMLQISNADVQCRLNIKFYAGSHYLVEPVRGPTPLPRRNFCCWRSKISKCVRAAAPPQIRWLAKKPLTLVSPRLSLTGRPSKT